jgi:hypothetical protein
MDHGDPQSRLLRLEMCSNCGASMRHFVHLSRVRCRECGAMYESTRSGIRLLSPDPELVAKRKEEDRLRTEEVARAAATAERERHRVGCRDADAQDDPYEYRCAGHPNRTLALRYGIANVGSEVREYVYYGRGGEPIRNPSRDRTVPVENRTIRIRKLQALGNSQFIAELPDFGTIRVRVVIERGTEYVSTFLPRNDAWFTDHAALEDVLKGNPTFSLKEVAKMHVDKAIPGAGGPLPRVARASRRSLPPAK